MPLLPLKTHLEKSKMCDYSASKPWMARQTIEPLTGRRFHIPTAGRYWVRYLCNLQKPSLSHQEAIRRLCRLYTFHVESAATQLAAKFQMPDHTIHMLSLSDPRSSPSQALSHLRA